MNKKPPIQWTEKQIQVAQLLQQGLLNSQVAQQLGVAKSLVSKVTKALKKGFMPPAESHEYNKAIAQYIDADSKSAQSHPQGNHGNAPQDTETKEAVQADQAGSSPSSAVNSQAVLLRLVPMTATIPMTPIMLNARAYCIYELGWAPGVRWEDMIDTIFYHYFKSIGVILQGWYEEEPKDKEGSPRPAGEKGQGNCTNSILHSR